LSEKQRRPMEIKSFKVVPVKYSKTCWYCRIVMHIFCVVCHAVGLAYSCQVVPEVPVDDHDKKVGLLAKFLAFNFVILGCNCLRN